MKYYVSQLTGRELSAAVAKAEGRLVTPADNHPNQPGHVEKLMEEWGDYVVLWYSKSGEVGGWEAMSNQPAPAKSAEELRRLIEKYKVSITYIPEHISDESFWYAQICDYNVQVPDHEGGTMPKYYSAYGDTVNEAVARVVVTYLLGEEVEL